MSKRIRIGSRVSTEAWRFDSRVKEDLDRWSYKQFGSTWPDARVFGIVVDRVGEKQLVLWDIDGETSLFETSVLTKEEDGQRSERLDVSKPGPSSVIDDSKTPDDALLMFSSDDECSVGSIDSIVIPYERILTPDSVKKQEHDEQNGISSSSEESGDEDELKLKSLEDVRLQNISDNKRMLQELGLSKRKFDRHVPNVLKSSCKRKKEDSSEDESDTDIDFDKDLTHGEEVHLIWEGKVFKASYDGKETNSVHGVALKEDEGCFFKVLRAASKWDGFDIDMTCVGAAVLWNKGHLKRRNVLSEVQQQGTEEKQPTQLEKPKRKRQPENWKVNKAKKAVNSGQEYKYQQKMKPPCSEKCRMKCQQKFGEEIRQQIFDQFYESGDKSIQTQQLYALVTEHKTSRKRGKDKENSRRSFSREYNLMKKGEKVRVCQTMFLNTFAIDKKRVRTLLKNKTETGTPLPDGRGKHQNHCREECEEFNNSSNPSDEDFVAQQNHIKDKDYVRNIKQCAKDSAARDVSKCAAAFDLQKVLLTPFGQTSSFYYSRRLTNFNFTITELDNMSTWCYFWSESECQKISCEVATSLLKYIIARKEVGVRNFYLFSDRCGGQNNKRMVFAMLSYALITYKLDSIRLTYLVSGHSQSENDNAHSVIEQMASKRTLYTPAEWESLIQCAFKKNRCTLEVLEHGDIIDYKSPAAFPEYASTFADKTAENLSRQQRDQQIALNLTLGLEKRKPEKIYWSEIVDILFSKDEPEIMKFKYSYDEDHRSATFSAPKRELRPKEQVARNQAMKKYLKPCGVTAAKKADLLKLCSKNLILQRHHRFYEELQQTTLKTNE